MEETTSQIVGTAAAFPRKLRFGSQERLGFVLGDFCVEGRYRSLGLSLQLQRACLAAIEKPSFDFLYDFPSRSMMAIYKRMNIEPCGQMVRWAKPLRAEEKLRRLIPFKSVARGLSVFVDPLLALRGPQDSESDCELHVHDGLCGQEFSQFDCLLCAQPGIRTVRDAVYLNWRYLSDLPAGYEILTARRAGKLVGFVVSTRNAKDASIVDLSSIDDVGVITRLLAGAVERLRVLGAATVSLNAGSAHPWNHLFERAGFRPREISPMVVAAAAGSSISTEEFNRNWFVMRGERDS